MRTSFNQESLGGIGGTEFLAEVETELGKGRVKFLVRAADAETRNKLKWVPFFSIEDMLDSLDETPSKHSPMWN